MNTHEFSIWCDLGKPALGPPKPPPAPPRKSRFNEKFFARLGESIGRVLTKFREIERARTDQDLAARDAQIGALEERLRVIENALLSRGLHASEPLALSPPSRGNGARDAH